MPSLILWNEPYLVFVKCEFGLFSDVLLLSLFEMSACPWSLALLDLWTDLLSDQLEVNWGKSSPIQVGAGDSTWSGQMYLPYVFCIIDTKHLLQ